MASGHGMDIHVDLRGRLCDISYLVEPGSGHWWRQGRKPMDAYHLARCGTFPSCHGGCVGHRCIWKNTRKNVWSQQWWHRTTHSGSCFCRTGRTHTSLWRTCTATCARIWSTSCQACISTCASVWSTGPTTTPRNLKETHHVRNHILDRSRSICRLELATTRLCQGHTG